MTKTREPFIDFARGFSIITIVLWHILNSTYLPAFGYKAIMLGGAGVHLFIFISGYGLGLSKYQGAAHFYKRRFLKVLAPYYIVVTFLFASNLIFPVYSDGWREYLSHILLYKMFSDHNDVSFGYHFWFISTIIQFYIFFPLINHLVTAISPVKAVVAATLISLAYSILILILYKTDSQVWNSFFLQFLWEFVLGIVIGRLDLLKNILSKSIFFFLIWGTVSFSIMGLLVLKGGRIGQGVDDYFSFIGYSFYCISLFKAGIGVINRFIVWVETFSYSLYLIHVHFIFVWLLVFHLTYLKWWDACTILALAFFASFFLEKFFKKIQKTPKQTTPSTRKN